MVLHNDEFISKPVYHCCEMFYLYIMNFYIENIRRR